MRLGGQVHASQHKVKITNETDISKLEKDSVVSIPVTISSVNGNLYYSQSNSVKFLKEMK